MTLKGEAALSSVCQVSSAEVSMMRSECYSTAARYHELLSANCSIVKVRRERKDTAANNLLKLHKVYNGRRKVIAKMHVSDLGNHSEQVSSLTNELEGESLELEIPPGLVPEAAQLRLALSDGWKDLEEQNEKLAFLGQVVDEIFTFKGKVLKLSSFLMKARDHLIIQEAPTGQQEVEKALMKNSERVRFCSFTSVMKK